MYVEISLFQTLFDQENIFCGNDKNDRQNSLNKWPSNKVIRLPRSSLNLRRPFRLAMNFLKIDRKYNYAEYKFFTIETQSQPDSIRHYFVNDIAPVNDNETDLIVKEDTLGDHFHDLLFSRIQPSQFTYPERYLKKDFQKIQLPNFYNVDIEEDFFSYVDNDTSQNKCLGAVIVTATARNNTSDIYYEGIVSYPISTLFVPFLFDKITRKILTNIDFRIFASTEVIGINQLNEIYKVIDSGFKVVSSAIVFNLKDYFYVETAAEGIYRIQNNASVSKTQYIFNRESGGTISVAGITGIGNVFQNIKISDTGPLNVFPYKKIRIEMNGTAQEIDPSFIPYSESSTEFNVKLSLSFVPPYTTTLFIDDDTQYTLTPAWSINNDMQFYNLDNAFSDWYKSNYNSAITGLKVSQDIENKNFAISAGAGLINSGLNLGASLFGSSQTKAGKKGGGGPTPTAITSGVLGAIGNIVDTGSSAWVLNNNQQKARELLDLRMRDIKNTPDQVTFMNSLSTILINKRYFRLFLLTNTRFDSAAEYHNAYGYECFRKIDVIQEHQRFDYIKSADIIIGGNLDYAKCFFSEAERTDIEQQFANGVRLWWSDAKFKRFDLPNEER